MLSADIVGSTALYEAAGDAAAQSLIASALDILKSKVVTHRGKVIAEIGDQIVALFTDAADAASAATEMHVQLHEQHQPDAENLASRIGLHWGEIPAEGDVLSTQTAKIADWASNNAKSEQTLATRHFIEQLPRIFRALSRYVDDETWNFISLDHVELFEIIWDVESITAFSGEQPPREARDYDGVEFVYGGQTVCVNDERPVISIGRQEENDLVINRDLISRQHLSAQFSRGRCTVTDNSTNGSVIRLASGERFEIKRESFRLSGSGTIIPGNPDSEPEAFTIVFRCR